MRIIDLIEKKKNNLELSQTEIKFLISQYVLDKMPDYQMSAFAMAVTINGMTEKETTALTIEMMLSGDTIDLSSIKGIKVDKHSTGGVGDKTTIVVGPIIASLGIPFAKMSGRGLGFTGGTLDKLESIPNFNISYSNSEFINQIKKIGIAVIGQTKNIVPADKKLYSLRDVTATVQSLPLITASIMSKKLATGSDAILLDVKCGNGALMKTYDKAKELATWMIKIGEKLNKDVRAEITSMERPLGRAIGNKNEIVESINTLKGNGPKDLVEVVESTCSTILVQSKKFTNKKVALKKVREVIKNGKAFEKFKDWIQSQNGDVEKILKKDFWKPKFKVEIKANKNGFMKIISAINFGIVAMKLGAGREKKEDIIDNEAGIYLNKKTNEKVNKGDVLFTLYSSKKIPANIFDSLQSFYKIVKNQIENKIILGRL